MLNLWFPTQNVELLQLKLSHIVSCNFSRYSELTYVDFQRKFHTFLPLIWAKSLTSIHLVKSSMTTKRKCLWVDETGNGPKRYIPQCERTKLMQLHGILRDINIVEVHIFGITHISYRASSTQGWLLGKLRFLLSIMIPTLSLVCLGQHILGF